MRPLLHAFVVVLAFTVFCAPGVAQAAVPVMTTPPSISGTAADGWPLTADPGTWDGGGETVTFSYQWYVCDAALITCTPAPQQTSTTYVVQPSDVGSRIRVTVLAETDSGWVLASATTGVVISGTPYPGVAPSIPGMTAAAVGTPLLASAGTWRGPGPISYTYQWQRCDIVATSCNAIPGATSLSYVITASDWGWYLRVNVTATNANGSNSASSGLTPLVTAVAPANVVPPSVSGTPYVGLVVSLQPGVWSGSTLSYGYQWERCDSAGASCAAIGGATSLTYTLTSADLGGRVRAVVTASGVGPAASATSGVTPIVANAPAAAAATPALSVPAPDLVASIAADTLTPAVGAKVTYRARASVKSGSGIASGVVLALDLPSGVEFVSAKPSKGSCFTYGQLVACELGILGYPSDVEVVVVVRVEAVGSLTAKAVFTPAPADASPANNKAIAVVTARAASGNAARLIAAAAPSVRGLAKVGGRLTAVPGGGWNVASPYRFEYRWQSGRGGAWTDIRGAKGRSLAVTRALVGSRVRVVVTAVGATGGEFRISAATATVRS